MRVYEEAQGRPHGTSTCFYPETSRERQFLRRLLEILRHEEPFSIEMRGIKQTITTDDEFWAFDAENPMPRLSLSPSPEPVIVEPWTLNPGDARWIYQCPGGYDAAPHTTVT